MKIRAILLLIVVSAVLCTAGNIVVLNNDLVLPDMPQQSLSKNFFIISNASDEPIVINKVKTTCGCTYANAATNVIGPHQTTVVQFAFKSEHRKGEILKSLGLITDKGEYDLHFSVNVISFFTPPEGAVELGEINRAKTRVVKAKAVIDVYSGCTDVQLMEVLARPGAVELDWSYKRSKAQIQISLKVYPGAYKGKALHDGVSFTMFCDGHAQRRTLPIHGTFTD